MKRFLILLSLLFCNVVFADTINLHWLNEDGTTYQDSTCVIDSDLILPSTPPTKYGYTFTGWKIANYIPIEYLESTGTQYIDLGTTVSSDYTFIIKMAWTQIKEVTTFFGSKEYLIWTNGRYIGLTYYAYEKTFYGRGQTVPSSDLPTRFTATVDTVNNITFKPSSGKLIFNGVEYVGVGPSQTTDVFTTANNPYIFATNQAGTPAQFDYVRLYNFKVHNSNNVLIRDFVPVLDMNGVPCLFDRVEAKFYYNQGKGQFIAGPTL